MAPLDIDFVRSQFPAFDAPSLNGWAHFENAGGSYACGQVINHLSRYYLETKVQPYGWSDASIDAGRRMDSARSRMAGLLNVSSDEVLFGPSTTQNVYVLAQAMRSQLQPGDEIVVTNLDHEANIGAWRRLAQDGLVVREWAIDPESGDLDLDDLGELLSERTRVVAFSHCSNIVGTINPVKAIVDRVHEAGAIAVVDGVSYCGHGLPDVNAIGADVYLFSLYKVYGPHQGVMVLRRALGDDLPNQGHFFNAGQPTARLVPAGPDHAQIAACNGVVDYFDAVHDYHHEPCEDPSVRSARVLALFQAQERRLLQPLLDYLSSHRKVRLIGHNQAVHRAPTVALTVAGHTPQLMAEGLASHRLGTSAGHFYAARCVEALGIDPAVGLLRLSFVHYTSEEELNRLIAALDQLI